MQDLSGRKPLSPKRELLAQTIFENPLASVKDIAAKAGYAADYAVTIMHDDDIQTRVRYLLHARDKIGLPSLIERIEKGLDACSYKWYYVKGQDEPKSVEYPNHDARIRYIELALCLHGIPSRLAPRNSNDDDDKKGGLFGIISKLAERGLIYNSQDNNLPVKAEPKKEESNG